MELSVKGVNLNLKQTHSQSYYIHFTTRPFIAIEQSSIFMYMLFICI